MRTPTEVWKKWVGRTVDGKFPLRQWLGGSDHSAVFLTERSVGSQRAVIKLIPAPSQVPGNLDETAQLSRWAGATRLNRPHLIRLFEWGRCQIGDTRLLYVVMEYAEENLAEILPLRPLSANEASEMLRPTAETLDSLHRAGFVHGRIKPSNILAVGEQLKISADTLRKNDDPDNQRDPSAYDAPEVAAAGASPAGDIWSLGMTLVAVLTQKEPQTTPGKAGAVVVVPETIPQPLHEIARKCLQSDPRQRGTADGILSRLQASAPRSQVTSAIVTEGQGATGSGKRWLIAAIAVVVFVAVLAGIKFANRAPAVPATETKPAAPAESPATQPPAPFSENKKPSQKGMVRGSVLQQVPPEVSRSAQNTITGHIKVSVQVEVDAAGSVSQARLVSLGPSKYFANHALEAARRWKFTPPQVDGQAVASEWIVRFQFGRADIQAFPAETRP